MRYENLNRCMLLLALPAIALATGCAHQPTLKRAARPFMLAGNHCQIAPLAIVDASNATTTIAPVVVVNPRPKPALVQKPTAPAQPIAKNTPPVFTVSAPRPTTAPTSNSTAKLTGNPIQQTSANETAVKEMSQPRRYMDLQAARLPSPVRSNDLPTGNASTGIKRAAKPVRSFGFNDLQRDDAPTVSVEVPPSMRTEPAAKWGTTTLTDVPVEQLKKTTSAL